MLHNDYDNWQAKASYGDDRPTDPSIWGSASNETVKMVYDDQDWAIFGSVAAIVLLTPLAHGQPAADKDKDVLPPQLTKEQRENLQRFLEKHERPDRYLPPDAKVVSPQPSSVEVKDESKPGQPVKQYMVQIISHRPVPGEEQVKRVDVVYYRPNPERGKPGITVRHTVDLATGEQVGATFTVIGSVSPGFRSTAVSANGSRAALVANSSVTIIDTAAGEQVGDTVRQPQ